MEQFLRRNRRAVLTAVFLLLLLVLLFLFRDRLDQIMGSADAIKAFVAGLGWWGPVALIAINILQIIIAPIPGYAVYIGAGFLFGPLWGGIWGSVGMLLGGMLAMAVGRNLGRPIVQRIIGIETLTRWEEVAHSDSLLVWGVILLSPIGDSPFLLAGLSNISFSSIFILTIITRVPAAFAAAAVGAGAFELTWWEVTLIVLLLAIPFALVARFQTEITDWFHNLSLRLAKRG